MASRTFCGRFLQENSMPASARRFAPSALGLYIPAPAIFTELIHLYLARDLTVGAASPDADEELDLKWLPLDQAIQHVVTGEWNDGKTAMALWRAQYQLQM
jgi:8-oxo-dGTP pyrophosphatase MutT (NUDIX family)